MKKSILVLFLIMLSLLIFTPTTRSQQLVCEEANGLDWCYNPNACGQACNDVCAVDGRQPIADNNVWFEAQNTEEKCQAISQAFGLGNDVTIAPFSTACLQDFQMPNHGSGINAPLECSTFDGCPEDHRTEMDELGVPCGSGDGFPRRSICPCEPLPTTAQVPTLSEWGLIVLACILGFIGFMVIRKRKVTA